MKTPTPADLLLAALAGIPENAIPAEGARIFFRRLLGGLASGPLIGPPVKPAGGCTLPLPDTLPSIGSGAEGTPRLELARGKAMAWERTCSECPSPVTGHASRKTCSDRCQASRRARLARGRYHDRDARMPTQGAPVLSLCARKGCGVPVLPARHGQRYCSRRCTGLVGAQARWRGGA